MALCYFVGEGVGGQSAAHSIVILIAFIDLGDISVVVSLHFQQKHLGFCGLDLREENLLEQIYDLQATLEKLLLDIKAVRCDIGKLAALFAFFVFL